MSFDVSAPGVAAVTGENGSGKSTLLRILCGLLRPSRGQCVFEVDGRAVEPRRRRLFTGLATPELSFYEEFSAAENLAFAAETRGLPNPTSAVRLALERVGLTPRADDRVSAFSSGMKQRLRLAFAILHEPPVIMLDEPGSHLDDAGRAVVEHIVQTYGPKSLVLIATNEPREMALAERRIELSGRGLERTA
ncbi:MAG: ABC transporter ATP-binding protein [Candidatus Eisenbacteria bacterium]|uniref:ABC transporter ATP-binding protein n=1 Tax=Eiseniibacteriota bacterium TaxID=2212470 RepID=A0A933SEL3_UNCEI|nr:ABC transporter ATP-binding protein [Candidatus Eisenbacteria bacterium]